MAGPGKGTWVKVKGKNGAVRTEVIGATVGGNNFSKGQVITQAQYQKTQQRKDEQDSTPSRKERINQIKEGINQRVRDKAREIFGTGSAGITDQNIARFNQSKAGQQATALGRMERNAIIPTSDGSGNRAKRRLAEMRAKTQKQEKQAPRLQKAALSKAEKTQILLKNKNRLKAEAMKSSDGYDRVKRINRLESADRKRRKAQNPDAPAFQRAKKASQTRRQRSMNA
jgi:hypothetical protein